MIQRRKRGRVVSEINITPFTDVVLVLLIIFMITTPLLMQPEKSSENESGFDVQLPMAKSKGIPSMPVQVVIVILQDGRMVLTGETVSEDTLKEKLKDVKTNNPQALVIVQADRMVNHWRVVRAMDIAAEVGLNRLAIATQGE
jgi:biopolymer transport protein TolR